MISWKDRNFVYCSNGFASWACSGAMIPTPILHDESTIRIFAGFLDASGRSRIGYLDVCGKDPTRILDIGQRPVLDIGQPGAFDDNGVVPISLVRHGQELRLYYVGFQLRNDVPYTMLAGLAISTDEGKTFTRPSDSPLLPPIPGERYVRTAPFVLKEGNTWKAWYIGGDSWITIAGKKLPTYSLKFLTSSDGLTWEGQGSVCLEPQQPDEFGFGRPWILYENGKYCMFYSIRSRSNGYRLGYAESNDALQWTRCDDQIGMDITREPWENENICYTALLTTKNDVYLFYNGNNYGKTGFGYARLDSWCKNS